MTNPTFTFTDLLRILAGFPFLLLATGVAYVAGFVVDGHQGGKRLVEDLLR